jgi:hypothetical protein
LENRQLKKLTIKMKFFKKPTFQNLFLSFKKASSLRESLFLTIFKLKPLDLFFFIIIVISITLLYIFFYFLNLIWFSDIFITSFCLDNSIVIDLNSTAVQMGSWLSIIGKKPESTPPVKANNEEVDTQSNQSRNSVEDGLRLTRPASTKSIDIELLEIKQDKGKGKAKEADSIGSETEAEGVKEFFAGSSSDTASNNSNTKDFSEGSSIYSASKVSYTTSSLPRGTNNTPEPGYHSDQHPTNNPEDYAPRSNSPYVPFDLFKDRNMEIPTPEPEEEGGCFTGLWVTVKEGIKDIFN